MKNILHLYFKSNTLNTEVVVHGNGETFSTFKIPNLLFPYVDLKSFIETVKTEIQQKITEPVTGHRVYNSTLSYYQAGTDYYERWCKARQLNPEHPIDIQISCFNEKGEYIQYNYVPRTEKYDILIQENSVILNIDDAVFNVTVGPETTLNSIIADLNGYLQSINPTLKISFKDMLTLNTFKAYSQLIANELFVRHNDLYFKDFKTSLNYKMKSLLEDRKKASEKSAIEDDIKSLNILNNIYEKYLNTYLKST